METTVRSMHARLSIRRLHGHIMHDSRKGRSENDDHIVSRVLANECDATVATNQPCGLEMKEPGVKEVPGFAHHFQYSAQEPSLICPKPNMQASFLIRGTTKFENDV